MATLETTLEKAIARIAKNRSSKTPGDDAPLLADLGKALTAERERIANLPVVQWETYETIKGTAQRCRVGAWYLAAIDGSCTITGSTSNLDADYLSVNLSDTVFALGNTNMAKDRALQVLELLGIPFRIEGKPCHCQWETGDSPCPRHGEET